MASEQAAVALLIGLGVSELSVSIPMVPEIKAQVRSLDLGSCRKLAEKALELDTAAKSGRWSKRPSQLSGRAPGKTGQNSRKTLKEHEHNFVC
jgi:phosphoenolpyruvate-protein kinase (PTS system EI component)